MFALSILSVGAQASCPSDALLKSKGWVIYNSNFNEHYTEAHVWMTQDSDSFKDLNNSKNQVIRSSVANKFVRLAIFDHLESPQELMFGDVVTLVEAFDGTPVEVRWFIGNRKYAAYDREQTPCVTNLIPYAENALY